MSTVNDVGIIVQARTNSSRLPGKVVAPFWNGLCLLEIVINTCKRNSVSRPVIVATSIDASDDVIEHIARQNGVPCFRGSNTDVLSRYVNCAEAFGLKEVVRVCSDNPFLSAVCLNALLEDSRDFDYLSYVDAKGIPAIRTHLGVFCEKVKVDALRKVDELTTENIYREHVTNFIYSNPELFNIHFFSIPEQLYRRDDIRLTCDTDDDFTMLKSLYAEYKSSFGNECFDILIQLIDKNNYYRETMQKGIRFFNK